MGHAIPVRTDYTAGEVRRLAQRAKDAAHTRPFLPDLWSDPCDPWRGALAGVRSDHALTDDIDVSRGDVFATPTTRPEVSDQFAAHVVWMDEEQLIPGRSYRKRPVRAALRD